MENSKIAWTDHTFSPWRGCTKVSPGCANCYAEALSRRNPAVLGEWGPAGTRAVAAEAYWMGPTRWNRVAQKAQRAARVFCLSLGDICEDNPALAAPRARLGALVASTWWLDWLMLTKRPERWDATRRELWPPHLLVPPFNAWLGASVENQEEAERRLPHLLRAKLHTHAVRFVSYEPALGPVDFSPWLPGPGRTGPFIDWIIVGGESTGSRPFHVSWARSVLAQGAASGVPVFVKQLGSHPVSDAGYLPARVLLRDRKHGADPIEWPADLRVQQVPPSLDDRISTWISSSGLL